MTVKLQQFTTAEQ